MSKNQNSCTYYLPIHVNNKYTEHHIFGLIWLKHSLLNIFTISLYHRTTNVPLVSLNKWKALTTQVQLKWDGYMLERDGRYDVRSRLWKVCTWWNLAVPLFMEICEMYYVLSHLGNIWREMIMAKVKYINNVLIGPHTCY